MARLVAIGDSLTQGFQSAAITHTDLSFPALVAERMGIPRSDFRVPNFMGAGGLPCNLEWLARELQLTYGANLHGFEWLGATLHIAELIERIDGYWERGPGAEPVGDILFHNLAVWGFEAGDAIALSAGRAKAHFAGKEDWLTLPSASRERTAYRVLNPAQTPTRDSDTQIEIAKRIKEQDGKIDHLIVWLGANNCLATVVELKVFETGPTPPGSFSTFTLWTTEAFRAEYKPVADQIAAIDATHVYVATVPHVTIPPITRGVMKNKGSLPDSRKYFDYYTRFWIQDKDFDPGSDPRLTGAEAQHIDEVIDQYNDVIRESATEHGWHVVDLCRVLDDLAVRRNHGMPRYLLPPALSDLSVRFFEIQPSGGVANGGLISLDGVHPTTCGYALVAQEFIKLMRPNEPGIMDIDFDEVRRWDSLVSSAPRTLDDVFGMLETLERRFHFSRWLRPGP